MIDNLLDAALEQLSPNGGLSSDEDLIENLGLLSQDEPAARRAAVDAMLHARGSFWSAERVDGAVAALTPVAADEADEDLAERLGTLLGALFAHSADALGQPGERTHQDALISLLDAEAAEIRGFAASSLARAADSAEPIALALAREPRWDVAMRMAGALVMLDEPLSEAAIIGLIDAPTEEAVSVAARHITERPFAASRPSLLRRLLREPATSALHRPLRRALNHADAAEAYRIVASSDDVEEGESLAFLDFSGRKAALKAELVQDPERDAPSLRVLFSLPGDLEDNRSHYARACALIAGILQIPLPVDQIALNDEGATFDLSLTRDPPLVAIHALGPVLGLIEETLQPFDRPSARRPELIEAAMALLLERLERLEARDGRLRAAFEGATLLRTHDGGHALVLDQATIGRAGGPRVTFALAFDRAAITRDDPASGLLLALSFDDLPEIPDPSDLDRYRSALCAAIAWKTGVLAAPSTRNPALLDALGLPHGPLTIHLRGQSARPALTDVDALVRRASRLSAFLRNLARLVTRGGVSLFELTGAPRPSTFSEPALAALTPKPRPEEIAAPAAQDVRRKKLEALQRKAAETTSAPAQAPPPPEAEVAKAPPVSSPRTQSAPASSTASPDRPASIPSLPSARPSTPALPSSAPSTPALPPSLRSTPALPSGSAKPSSSTPSLPSATARASTHALPPSLPSTSARASTPALPPSLPSASARPSTPAQPSSASTPDLPSTSPTRPSKPAPDWPPRDAMARLSSPAQSALDPSSSTSTPSLPSTSATSPSLPSTKASKATPSLTGGPTQPPSSLQKASAATVGSGLQPLDDKGRTPTEVVRELDADIAKVDIYLRFAGYNTGKLAQIMSILLSVEMSEARALIEKSPCILIEDIPRDRGRTIKTVLEGTGARIAVTPHGEGLEQLPE